MPWRGFRDACFVTHSAFVILASSLTNVLFVKNESYLQWLAAKQDAPLLAARSPEYL